MNKSTLLTACLALGACGAQPSNPAPDTASTMSVASNSIADLKMNAGH